MKTEDLKIGNYYSEKFEDGTGFEKIKYTGKNLGQSFGFEERGSPLMLTKEDVNKYVKEYTIKAINIQEQSKTETLEKFKDELIVPVGYKKSYSKFLDCIIIYKPI